MLFNFIFSIVVIGTLNMTYWYRYHEDRAVSWITTNIWRPKRIGGSSIAKADLFIRAFYRLFVISIPQFILVAAGLLYTEEGPYRAGSLAAPLVSLGTIYIFCRTDSERKASYSAFTVIGLAIYLTTPSEQGFDVFVMQSSAFLIINGLALGFEGVLIATLTNFFMGYLFMHNQRKLMPERDLAHEWEAFAARVFSEGMFMIVNIAKFSETFARFEQADKHKTEFLCRMSHELRGQLVKLGCEVDIAANGQIAVQKLKLTPQPHYDLILLDLEMPVKDGIETAAELREMGVTTPIIALTAHAVEEKRTMALKAGMDDFLMKPCSIDTLKRCLDGLRHPKKFPLVRSNSNV